MLAVGSLLFLCRADLPPALWRRSGVAWGIAVLVLGISLDQAYPVVQTRQALATVGQIGGKVVQNDLGIVVDFGGVTALDDAEWQRIMPTLAPLQPIAELRLQGTAIGDRTLDALVKWPSLTRVDVTGTRVSAEGLQRLTRYHSKLEVISGQSTQQ